MLKYIMYRIAIRTREVEEQRKQEKEEENELYGRVSSKRTIMDQSRRTKLVENE